MSALEKFSDNQVKALHALVEHGSTTKAAESCGLTPRTIRRYREDPEFSAELSRLRGELLSEVVGELLASSSEAVQALRRGCTAQDDQGRPDRPVQVRAASSLLTLLFKGTDVVDLEARLRALEETFGTK